MDKSERNLLAQKKEDAKWKIEYAKSSRAKCRKCGDKIEKGEVRIGKPTYFQDNLTYHWHHEKCVFMASLDSNEVTGLDELEEYDRKRIETNLGT